MIQRRTALIGVYLTFVLAFLGLLGFVGGIVVEISSGRTDTGETSAAVLVALGGLFIIAVMFLIWFAVIGFMLARQTRVLGSGYGDAYRLIEQFRFRDAIPLLERSIREGKESVQILMLLTSAYAYTGQFAKAQSTADRAVQLYPDDADAYITLANGYRLQALYDESARALAIAAELAPDRPIIWAELGFARRLAGDDKGAFEALARAAEHPLPAPYAVRVHYHLRQAYMAQGAVEQAVRSTAKMMSARDGLVTWKAGLRALEGTAYGQALRYEIAAIEAQIADADAGSVR
ncbi:MAG: tetratricopeptide repeat protein [Candidatus Flexifilum sp.]